MELQHQLASNEYSRLIFFRIDWFDLLAVQGTLKSISSSALSLLYGPTLTSVQDCWKSFDYILLNFSTVRQINWHPVYRDEVTVLPTYTLRKLKSQYSNLCLCHSNTQDFNLSETGSRCYLPSCHQPCHQPQGKAIGDSFHKDRNSKTSIVGQLREEAGSYPDTDFLFSQSRELPDHSSAEKVPWRSKRSYVEGCSLPMCLFCKVHLG